MGEGSAPGGSSHSLDEVGDADGPRLCSEENVKDSPACG